MGAGLEHLSWAGGTLRSVDLLLVVAEPAVKSLVTARRTSVLARELGIPWIGLVVNRLQPDEAPRTEVFALTSGIDVVALVPDDQAVRYADRVGRCLLDCAPEAPAVRAIQRLADELERCLPGPAAV